MAGGDGLANEALLAFSCSALGGGWNPGHRPRKALSSSPLSTRVLACKPGARRPGSSASTASSRTAWRRPGWPRSPRSRSRRARPRDGARRGRRSRRRCAAGGSRTPRPRPAAARAWPWSLPPRPSPASRPPPCPRRRRRSPGAASTACRVWPCQSSHLNRSRSRRRALVQPALAGHAPLAICTSTVSRMVTSHHVWTSDNRGQRRTSR
jgi:hypothetical protein